MQTRRPGNLRSNTYGIRSKTWKSQTDVAVTAALEAGPRRVGARSTIALVGALIAAGILVSRCTNTSKASKLAQAGDGACRKPVHREGHIRRRDRGRAVLQGPQVSGKAGCLRRACELGGPARRGRRGRHLPRPAADGSGLRWRRLCSTASFRPNLRAVSVPVDTAHGHDRQHPDGRPCRRLRELSPSESINLRFYG